MPAFTVCIALYPIGGTDRYRGGQGMKRLILRVNPVSYIGERHTVDATTHRDGHWTLLF
jgi:hypothetical protein